MPWRARCVETRTAGSESGLGKRTDGNTGTAPQADSTSQNGEWWDPVGNVCRPTLAPFPPNCGDGQYWNPVSNACRPLGQV